MARLFIVVDDDVERRLRLMIAMRGGKKGDLSATIEEAVEDWLKKHARHVKSYTRALTKR